MRKIALSVCCLLCSVNAPAVVVVSTSELPGDIQTCFQSSQCTSPLYLNDHWVSTTYVDGVTVLEYTQGGLEKRLIRYDLLSPPGTVSGTAWLAARNLYDIQNSNSHEFVLYFGDSMLTLGLNNQDLADGSAFRTLVADWIEVEPGYYEFGSVATGGLGIDLPLCLSLNCGSSAHFNLLHMDYVDGTFQFDPFDARDMLYTMTSWYDDCIDENCDISMWHQSLYVHAVPLPASAMLFFSGLIVGSLAMRKKASNP